jgi:hypothetical protein
MRTNLLLQLHLLLGELTVGGDINATYNNFDVTGNLTVGGSAEVDGVVTAGSFSFDNNIQVMKVIPNFHLESLINLGDPDVSAAITYLNADQFSVNPDTQYIAAFTGGAGFITIPVDSYVVQFGNVHALALWMMSSASGSTANVTVELQVLSLVGSDTSWTTLADDTQSVSTSLSRTPFEFDLDDTVIDLLNNTYQIVISTTGELDTLGIWRVGVLTQDSSVPILLGKFP